MIANPQVQQFMQMDLSPFIEIRQMLIHGLNRLPEEVQKLAIHSETRIIPSDSEWVQREPTGRQYVVLTFANDEQMVFERDHDDVRLGQLPPTIHVITDEGGGDIVCD
jgi:hypothetical protein